MSQAASILSPNTLIMPLSAFVNEQGHLLIGGCDTVKLVEEFGSPLYIVDEATVTAAVKAVQAGLSVYKNAQMLYAGKAFLCMAMAKLISNLGAGLDVVSEGELYTALQAGVSGTSIFLHGNNKGAREIELAITNGARIVADNTSEIDLIARLARSQGKKVPLMLRVIPGVAPDTHHHIQTGQADSKFGIPLNELHAVIDLVLNHQDALDLQGLHAHIGSQTLDVAPFVKSVNVLADLYKEIKETNGVELKFLDVGGGLGIAYTEEDKPISLFDWARDIANHTADAFAKRDLLQPHLFVEPGRSIIGTAGVTIYRVGHCKQVSGSRYIAVDGGMSDNPRPITYEAKYTAKVANRMNQPPANSPVTLVGRFCESGDILIKDVHLTADTGDLIAVFGTGAYNYSMASNYNRTGKPACLLVYNGAAEVIIERETNSDLVRFDRIPDRLK